jgi:DNA modification methylase
MFSYESNDSTRTLKRLLERYSRDPKAISVDFRKLVPFLVSPERATHLIHPYPAKLLVHIPFFFFSNNILSKPGDIVADPFCGSGTVLLEGQLAGRIAIGADTNPLARLISKVKSTPLESQYLENAASRLLERIPTRPQTSRPEVVNIDHWFYPHVAKQLHCLSEAIDRTRDKDLRNFFEVCLSSCVKKVSLSDPRLSVPVRLRTGQYPEGHSLREKTDQHLRRLKRVKVVDVFNDILTSNKRRLKTIEPVAGVLPMSAVVSEDARSFCTGWRAIKGKNSSGVQLVITSPPYPGAQKYIRSSSLSLGWLNLCEASELSKYKHATIGREEFRQAECLEIKSTGISSADRILKSMHAESPVRAAIASTYLIEMRQVLNEIWQVLNPGGYLVLVAANNTINGCEFRTQNYLRLIAEQIGFTCILRLVDSIRSRGLMTKRNKTASIITREYVLLFSKEKSSA